MGMLINRHRADRGLPEQPAFTRKPRTRKAKPAEPEAPNTDAKDNASS